MPFKSKKQQRWAFATDQPFAKDWADKTDFDNLPENDVREALPGRGMGNAPKHSVLKKLRLGSMDDPRVRSKVEQRWPGALDSLGYDTLEVPRGELVKGGFEIIMYDVDGDLVAVPEAEHPGVREYNPVKFFPPDDWIPVGRGFLESKDNDAESDGEREDPIDDEIEGGKGDDADPQDFDNDQVLMGIRIELEHTNDIVKALEITLDHLTEDPEYYTKLTAMEKGACDEPVPPKLEKVYRFSSEPDEEHGDDPFDTGQMKTQMRFGQGHSGGVGSPSR